MKTKWSDPDCSCEMSVIRALNDQYRVIYLKKCELHKTDKDFRNVWKHHVITI